MYWPANITANRLGRQSQVREEGDVSSDTNCKGVAHCLGKKRRQRASCLSQLGLL